MLVRELPILKAKADLEFRQAIYHAWLANLEGEQHPALATYYHYLKNHLGLRLDKHTEGRLVARSSAGNRGQVSSAEMQAAEQYGLFDFVQVKGWSKWQVVLWGRLACLQLFTGYGTNSQELLEDLDLHLIIGHQALEDAPEDAHKVQALVLDGHGLERIALETGKSKASIFACLWHLAA